MTDQLSSGPAPGPPAPAVRPADPDLSRGEPVPRVLSFAVVKRIDPRLPNTWGHWWIELDGEESYGWWPTPCPMGWRGALLGSRGCLNGIGTTNGGTATRDAYHGDEPDHWFHPTLIVAKTDDQVRAEIRAFAHGHTAAFRWRWWWLPKPAENCRTFQQDMFAAVGLFEEPEYLYTQGPGCPFMFQWRRATWRVGDLIGAIFGSGLGTRWHRRSHRSGSTSGAALAALRLSRDRTRGARPPSVEGECANVSSTSTAAGERPAGRTGPVGDPRPHGPPFGC